MKKLTTWIKDTAYIFSRRIYYLKKLPLPNHYLGYVKDNKVPVIILPGVFARWAFLKPIADHISLLGHPVYIVPKLGNNSESIEMSAKKVQEVIEENNLKNIIIVAHSKGGLISKYLLLDKDLGNKIKGAIAIATPWNGSSIGKFIPHSSVQELTHESKIIHYLRKHSEVDKKIISIIPSYDHIIWHDNGSHLDEAMENIKVEIAGHNLVVKDKKVWDVVVDRIEKISKL